MLLTLCLFSTKLNIQGKQETSLRKKSLMKHVTLKNSCTLTYYNLVIVEILLHKQIAKYLHSKVMTQSTHSRP